LKDKTEKLIKNKPSVIVGSFLGFLTVLYVPEFVQYLSAIIFGFEKAGLSFNFLYLIAVFELDPLAGAFINGIVILMPLIILFLISQLVSTQMSKIALGPIRYSLMLYQLILVGYVLFYLFYQAITIIINIDNTSDFVKLANLFGLQHPYNIFGIFFIIFILAVYININARKISKYINK
jgi:hypothetical protein